MDATIKTITYVLDSEIEEETPLGETGMRRDFIDSFVLTIDVGSVEGHQLYFAPEAIGNRMAGYSILTEKEAIETLVRELIFRWSPSLQPADSTDRVQVNGGTDDRIGVAWTKEAEAAHVPLVEAHADRIAAARATFSDNPPPGSAQASTAPAAETGSSVVFDAAAPDKPAA